MNIIGSNKTLYSDFDISFKPDPETGDIRRIENRECIRNSLLRIISLNKLDIPFNTSAYSTLKELLFETPSHNIEASIITNLTWICEELEPRVKIDRIEVTQVEDEATLVKYNIDLFYTILRTNTQDVATKEIERVR